MADRLDDLICTFHPGAGAMETLAILLLGWIIFGTILTIVGKFVYSRLLLDPPKETHALNSTIPPLSAAVVSAPVEKPNISNTERFINTLKSHPPPALPKLVRSKSVSKSEADQHPDVPSVTGSNSDCVKWVTSCLSFVYTRPQVLSDLNTSWKESINNHTKQSEIETGVSVEIQQILFLDDLLPRLNNVFCELTPNERATITGDFEARFNILVRAKREQRDHQTISDYRLHVERLRGRLNASSDFRDGSVAIKFDGWPDVRVSIIKDETITSISNDEQLVQDIIIEMVTAALRAATNQLHTSRYPDTPRFVPSINPSEPILPVHYDSMLETRLRRSSKDKKLLVKIVKANNLGSQKGVHQLYSIIEMDDPPQRHQTTIKQGTENPFWDENFLFDLGPNTEEIMFELYDRDKNRNTFLGLGIVGMEELLMNPSQRQIIPLQSRPYENDSVSGTLTVEFLFIDGMDVPNNLPSAVATSATKMTSSMDAESRLVRRDSYNRATQRHSDMIVFNELNDKPTSATTTSKHLEARRPSPRRGLNPLVGSREAPFTEGTEAFKDNYYSDNQYAPMMGSVASSLSSKDEDRNRGRSRRRSFFRTLKERLSRSKNRSRSVDPGTPGREDSLNRDDPLVRSVSADRARSGQLLAVPGLGGEIDSARSSLSEVSAISNASTRTYLDEASTLVLESTDNGVKKHYLIPMALAEKRKWKKKGVKLHIFSDHVFIAKHLTGGTVCQVCEAPLARRPGKQGYECRDCLLRCHKPCHVKVESLCPNSTVHFMELEYVEDTPGVPERKLRRN
ncbi:uncharacterized protein LOC130693609 [Daphnia carinata]|uniref:uncharacterized protein LOC130693609 n=1 Tax=Daphnia carinata TaxID=120202 RepID=UPI00257F303F|nr:uncharacterized protein LOC130693609 [Daphnia carinata]